MAILDDLGHDHVRGTTGSHEVTGVDKNRYIAKCDGWGNIDRSATNIVYQEWISARIAETIGVPIAPFQLLTVGNDVAFGSKIHPEVVSSRFTEGMFKDDRSRNQEILYLIAVFDMFIGNMDRHPENLLHVRNGNHLFLLAIDHSHCPVFAPNPPLELLRRKNDSGTAYIQEYVGRLLTDRKNLLASVDRVEALSDTMIQSLTDPPIAIEVSPKFVDIVVQFLGYRRTRLRHLINMCEPYIPALREGRL